MKRKKTQLLLYSSLNIGQYYFLCKFLWNCKSTLELNYFWNYCYVIGENLYLTHRQISISARLSIYFSVNSLFNLKFIVFNVAQFPRKSLTTSTKKFPVKMNFQTILYSICTTYLGYVYLDINNKITLWYIYIHIF